MIPPNLLLVALGILGYALFKDKKPNERNHSKGDIHGDRGNRHRKPRGTGKRNRRKSVAPETPPEPIIENPPKKETENNVIPPVEKPISPNVASGAGDNLPS